MLSIREIAVAEKERNMGQTDHQKKIDRSDPGIAFSMRLVENNPFMQWNRIEVDELDVDNNEVGVAVMMFGRKTSQMLELDQVEPVQE